VPKRRAVRKLDPALMPRRSFPENDRTEARRLTTGLPAPEFNAGVDIQVAIRNELDRSLTMEQALRLMADDVRLRGFSREQHERFNALLDRDADAETERKRVEREAELRSTEHGTHSRST